MIDDLPEQEHAWLRAFYGPPNGLLWDDIREGTAPASLLDHIQPWLAALRHAAAETAVVLPFVRGGRIVGWYASRLGPDGSRELGDELKAWLGPTYLGPFARLPETSGDPMAVALRGRFGGTVYRFAGHDAAANGAVLRLLADYRTVLAARPRIIRTVVRPVGSLRAEFDRAILALDEPRAVSVLAELRATGRLNEENLRYLDVRMKAGFGYWPQLARDHWLLATLSDLALPPQVLADLIEALFRTYVEPLEADSDLEALLRAFQQHVAARYPRLFASRRGVRSPRVLKAFILLERLQVRPNGRILADLIAQLPEPDRRTAWVEAAGVLTPVTASTDADAEAAFDDGQFDRAFELFLALPATRKSISRLLNCALTISTDAARSRFLTFVAEMDPTVLASTPDVVRDRIEALHGTTGTTRAPRRPPADGWMDWALRLKRGDDLASAEADVRESSLSWDVTLYASGARSQELADILGNLQGPAADVLRRTIGQVFAAFFSESGDSAPATKPIAHALFLLIAMDEALSVADLALLAQLTSRLLGQGLSETEYLSLVGDLADVQKRVASYAHLPWSLDVCEALAIAPTPSDRTRDARLQLFLAALGQSHAFAHRLGAQDLMVIEFLAKDYGVDGAVWDGLRRDSVTSAPAVDSQRLEGKVIGIYTLAESAGARAKQALESMFPGCVVEINSDLVCTARLSSLATAADLFVFAWKSSSHQAFFCVKDAVTKAEPIWASGKGTASILRAVLDAVG